jgi:hypothetical protein
MQYRLRTLLIIVALAAMSISLFMTTRRLHESNTLVANQRAEIRTLSHKLGILTAEDLPFVQIRRVLPDGELSAIGREDEGIDLIWLVHLPRHKNWRIFWADRGIPQTGLPTQHAGYRDLPEHETEWTWLTISFPHHSVLGWSADFSFGGEGGEQWNWPISSDQSGWLEPSAWTSGECAGPYNHHNHECFIEQFSCDKPIVIFRERRKIIQSETPSTVITHDDPRPCEGFILWLETAELPEP